MFVSFYFSLAAVYFSFVLLVFIVSHPAYNPYPPIPPLTLTLPSVQASAFAALLGTKQHKNRFVMRFDMNAGTWLHMSVHMSAIYLYIKVYIALIPYRIAVVISSI